MKINTKFMKETAKMQLTILLPNEINYGHTIDEAEKIDAISDAMEMYAQHCASTFLDWVIQNGWQKLDECWEYSNGEQHKTSVELYEEFKLL